MKHEILIGNADSEHVFIRVGDADPEGWRGDVIEIQSDGWKGKVRGYFLTAVISPSRCNIY